MVDFDEVGTANLWKSGPLFSTGPGRDGAHKNESFDELVLAGAEFKDCLASEGSGGDER
jgi:hypothetical protein